VRNLTVIGLVNVPSSLAYAAILPATPRCKTFGSLLRQTAWFVDLLQDAGDACEVSVAGELSVDGGDVGRVALSGVRRDPDA
jgi:hypothetical protein